MTPNRGEMRFLESPRLNADNDAAPPLETLSRACSEHNGLLSAKKKTKAGGEDGFVFTLACPVLLGGANLAAVALETEVPHGAYDEEDLQFLVLLCQSLAPLMLALQNLDVLRRDNAALHAQAGLAAALVGRSEAMQRVRHDIAEIAVTEANVLVTGETGTGKELVARLLHLQSRRHDKPFVTANCPAIPRELFESQLFGYEKGAFTGADHAFPGLLAEADGGTLFLDEVGDLAPDNQARLLRSIEVGTFRRLGATRDTRVNVRIVAATNKDIACAMAEGTLREDFYHRLSGFEIHVPPLRERRSDIPLLVEHFLQVLQGQGGHAVCRMTAEAVEYLRHRSWPGNVRELRNHILRAVSVSHGDALDLASVKRVAREPLALGQEKTPQTLAEVEHRHIEAVLRQCEGNVSAAARALRIGRTTLYKRLQEYGIDV